MDMLGKSGLGLELAKQLAAVKVPEGLHFDGIGAAAQAYLDQEKRAKKAEAEVERLREVLKNIAHFEPDRNSWSVKQARSALEAKP